MTQELFESIYAHGMSLLTADGEICLSDGDPCIMPEDDNYLYSMIENRFYYGRAPIGAARPYIVYHGFGFTNDDTFDAKILDCSLQFNVYSDDAFEAFEIQEYVKQRFDGAVLQVKNHESTRLLHVMQAPPMANEDEDPLVWMAAVEFSCKLQKEV